MVQGDPDFRRKEMIAGSVDKVGVNAGMSFLPLMSLLVSVSVTVPGL